MKRAFAIILAAAMLITCAGCSQGDTVSRAEYDALKAELDELKGNGGAAPVTSQVAVPTAVPFPEAEQQAPAQAPVQEQQLIDWNNIQIFYTGWVPDASYRGPGLGLRAVNNSGLPYMIQVRNLAVNDVLVEDIFSLTIVSGKMAYDDIIMTSDSLANAGVTSIEQIRKIDFNFIFYEHDNLTNNYTSEQIVLNF